MDYLMMRIPEVIQQYKDGLITQGEAIMAILSAVTVATMKHAMKTEEVLFEKTGKRPYELGL